jgi:signal transduction histidine kinase/ActR/RegA family two-component response regulator
MVKRSFLNMLNRIYRSDENDFENEIKDSFEMLLNFFKLKSIRVFQFSQDESFMRRLYSIDIFKGFENHVGSKEESVFDLLAIINKLKDGEGIFIENTDSIPKEWIFEKEYFIKYNLTNVLVMPITLNKERDGMGFFLLEFLNGNPKEEEVNRIFLELGRIIILRNQKNQWVQSLKSKIEENNILLNNTEVHIWYLINANTFGAVNKAHASFFRKNMKDMEYNSIYNVFEEEVAEAIVLNNVDVFMKKMKIKKESWISNGQGEKRLLMITYVPKMDVKQNVEYVICSAEDITEIHRVQQELIKAKETAEMESLLKSRFLANMSHEIRTPLNGIVGFLNILEQTTLSEEQLDYIKSANFACEGLLNVINDILDISKIEAGMLALEQKPFNIKTLLEDLVYFWKMKATEKNILLNLSLDEGLFENVIGDGQRVGQILNNLLSNGIKFTDKGQVSLGIKKLYENETFLEIAFEVKDTGVGISEENKFKLFTPFVQVDASSKRYFGGTGLGLSISKELAELMGGKLTFKSELGQGSKFTFVVKFDKNLGSQITHYKDQRDRVNTTVEVHGKNNGLKDLDHIWKGIKPTILLVEDNPINQRVASKILERNGLACDKVENGQKALEALLNIKYDVILMDCEMPVMDGYEATVEIRKIQKSGKRSIIIAMTANAMDGEREKCLQIGMDDYVSKPINVKLLIDAIRKHFPM